jgi:3',5'-cyclic AMP phosphodiesterase CpdA
VSGERLSRRELLARGAAGGLALALAGCGGVRLSRGGSQFVERTELAPAAPLGAPLGTIAHLTDAHVLDAESPARVTFLARLGSPFTSTFRPQESLTAQVMDGAVRAVNGLAPDAVIQGGDLIDNAQENELARGLALLAGGAVEPNSGGPGYRGVQVAGNPDPFYYRPGIDAPRHPGLLAAATRRFRAAGLRAPWYPVLGDHDLLVQGVVAPSPLTDGIARGDRAVWDLPSDLTVPAEARRLTALAPDGLPRPRLLDPLIRRLLTAPSVAVAADPERRELAASEVVGRLREAASLPGGGARLDYAFDVGERLRVIVLDLVRRDGGSDGIVHAGQPAWLARQLARAGERWVIVVSHQPLASSAGGARALALLDRHPRVLAALSGHTHRNRIEARPGAGGGYWLISTSSLIDYPQQARALRVYATAGGGVALRTWVLDHVPAGLGDVSRRLAYLDAQGGRPQGFAGDRRDRDATLYRSRPES